MHRALILALAIGATAAAPAAAQQVQGFKTWTAVCDNLKTCSAYGFTDDGADADAFIRVTRAAGPEAAASVILVLEGDDADKAPAVWRVSVDGASPPGLEAVATKVADGVRRAALSPVQSRALAEALRNGAAVKLAGGKTAVATISLSGSSAAFRWIDDRQGRVGTVTALVARGAKPASAVPPAPAAPVVRAAPQVAQDRLPDKLPAALWKLPGLKDCDAETRGEPPTVARLGPGQVLWGAPCSAGAYNLLSVLIIADEAGRGAREIVPPSAISDPNADNELMNINYDPATRTLVSFSKARGIGDCGDARTWVWDGKAFQLLDEATMPECKGVGSDDWPSLYHAVRAR